MFQRYLLHTTNPDNLHNDKLIWKSVQLTDLGKTLFFLKSDLNINNFTLRLHFLITEAFSKIQ